MVKSDRLKLPELTNRQLRPYYDSFYGSENRVFPETLPDFLTPFVLAIWYMDDGGVASKFHPRISFGLDDLSLERALKALSKLEFKPIVHGTGGDRDIMFPGQSDMFFALVGEYIKEIPCMAYKLPRDSVRRELDRNAKKLDKATVIRLLDEGHTRTEIARMFGVGTSTVARRLNQDPAPMGRPRKHRT